MIPSYFSLGALRGAFSRLRADPGRRRTFRWLVYTGKALCAGHLFTSYVYSISPASGPSMFPTFPVVGIWLLINRSHRRGREVRVGDLVTYKIPIFSHSRGIKRVIGMPGDYVLMDTPDGPNPEATMIQVPEGHCWLVGDNLSASRDSRMFGPVPLALVDGKVEAQFIPTLAEFWGSWRWTVNPFDEAKVPPAS